MADLANPGDAAAGNGDGSGGGACAPATHAAVHAFVRELSGRYNDRLPALQYLLQHKACVRCCWRFAGNFGACRLPDLPRTMLLDAVAAALSGHSPGAATEAAEPAAPSAAALQAPPPAAALSAEQPIGNGDAASAPPVLQPPAGAAPPAATAVQPADRPAADATPAASAPIADPPAPSSAVSPAAPAAVAAAAANAPPAAAGGSTATATAQLAGPAALPSPPVALEPVCPLCLGVLQSLDANNGLPPGGQCVALPEIDAGGGTWQVAASGCAAQLAQLIKQEGHETAHCSLSISVPAATQLRQVAALHALKAALPESGWLADPAAAGERITDVKTALRHALGPQLGRALGWQVTGSSDVAVQLMYMHPGTNGELDFLFGPGGDRKRYKRRRGERGAPGKQLAAVGRTSSHAIAKLTAAASPEDVRRQCGSPLTAPAHYCQVAVKVARTPVFVAGRYRKLGRNISHSPWLPGKCVTSVQEELARALLPTMHADSYKFNSAGREDFDVRMLGSGRPFTLEFANSRPAMPGADFFARAQEELNARQCGVEVVGLRAGSRADAALLKAGEDAKQKSYHAVCRLSRPPTPEQLASLNAMKDVVLAQQTPVRVAKRRADLVRSRTVHTLRCEMLPGIDSHCILDLRTQAGTYIKEFVHSDEGRTKPNLGSLLDCEAQILQLDVLEIHMDFGNVAVG